MKTVQVSEAVDDTLDWLVAKCEEHESRCAWMLEKEGYIAWQSYEQAWGNPIPKYSTDWSQGGPIIDENGIGLLFDSGSACCKPSWFATPDDQSTTTSYEGEYFDPAFMVDEASGVRGPTPLIAAMRCYCCTKLGNTVEVPDDLT